VGHLAIDAAKCIRCGACATIIPSVFGSSGGAYALLRQPASRSERELATAALINCPSSAIGIAS
jgi:ferredoxin